LYTLKGGVDCSWGPADLASFSPDGRYIVTVFSSRILIWDAVGGKLLHTTDTVEDGHTDRIRSLQYQPGKKSFFTAADDDRVKQWDLKTGKAMPMPEEQFGKVRALACSPDGKYLLTLGNKSVRIWLMGSWQEVHGIFPERHDIAEISFSPGGDRLLVTTTKLIQLCRFPGGQVIEEFKKSNGCTTACFSPDGKIVAARNMSFKRIQIRWWKTETGEMTDSLDMPFGNYSPLTYSKSGNYFAVGTRFTVKMWNPRTKRLPASLSSYPSWNAPLRMSNDGRFLLAGSTRPVIWQLSTSNILNGPNRALFPAIDISHNGKWLVTLADSQIVQLQDLLTGNILGQLKKDGAKVKNVAISHNDSCIAVVFNDHSVVVWDIPGGAEKCTFQMGKQDLKKLLFTHKDQYLIGVEPDGPASLWLLPGGERRYIGSGTEKVDDIDVSPDDRYVITSRGKRLRKWDLSSGVCLFDVTDDNPNRLLAGLDAWIYAISFSPDGKMILCGSINSYALVRDASSGKATDTLDHRNYVRVACYSPDGKYILTGSGDNTAKLWDASSKKLLQTFCGHTRGINSAIFSPNCKTILTSADDGTSKRWDLSSGNPLETFVFFDNIGYFAQDLDGYYTCDPRAAKALYFVRDREKISFEQLDVRYNRPDRVMASTGSPDTSLMLAYREAYYKRLEALGIDTGVFNKRYSVPNLDIVNRNQIEGRETNRRVIRFHIVAKDKGFALTRLKLWVNEVPVFGSRGMSIADRNSKELETMIPVVLSEGANKIEVSVVNRMGVESYRKPLTVTYSPAGGKNARNTVYFLGIGSGRFVDSTHDLDWSAKDIRDLVDEFRKRYGDTLVVDTLFDADVTPRKVHDMKKKLLTSKVDDKVVVAFSGHGLLSRRYDYYLSTYHVNFAYPENEGLPYGQLEDLLDSIPARRKLMLLDACNSGEFDKNDTLLYRQVQESLDTMGSRKNALPGVAGNPTGGHVGNLDTARIGMKNSFDLMRELFVNVGKNTGSVIIAATSGKQFAFENGGLKNGVFTYCIREVLRSGRKLKISELQRLSGERVSELTKGLQRPTTRDELISQDWYIW
jgi:WD40 repeat protein